MKAPIFVEFTISWVFICESCFSSLQGGAEPFREGVMGPWWWVSVLDIFRVSTQYFGHLRQKANSLEKTLMLGKIEGWRKRG